jgi:glutamine synthetase
MKDVTNEALKKKQLFPELKVSYEENIIKTLDEAEDSIHVSLQKLTEDTKKAEAIADPAEASAFYHDVILTDMEELRRGVDTAEAVIPQNYLPYPTYGEMLFSLR